MTSFLALRASVCAYLWCLIPPVCYIGRQVRPPSHMKRSLAGSPSASGRSPVRKPPSSKSRRPKCAAAADRRSPLQVVHSAASLLAVYMLMWIARRTVCYSAAHETSRAPPGTPCMHSESDAKTLPSPGCHPSGTVHIVDLKRDLLSSSLFDSRTE